MVINGRFAPVSVDGPVVVDVDVVPDVCGTLGVVVGVPAISGVVKSA